MKVFSCLMCFALIMVTVSPCASRAATHPDIDPCSLIAPEKVYQAFPALKNMEKSTIGPNTTCSYLDKFGISAFVISVHQPDSISAHTMMDNLDFAGCTVEDVAGLGKEAAMALTASESGNGDTGRKVMELYIKKEGSSLLLAPVRIQVPAKGPKFEQLMSLAGEMVNKLP